MNDRPPKDYNPSTFSRIIEELQGQIARLSERLSDLGTATGSLLTRMFLDLRSSVSDLQNQLDQETGRAGRPITKPPEIENTENSPFSWGYFIRARMSSKIGFPRLHGIRAWEWQASASALFPEEDTLVKYTLPRDRSVFFIVSSYQEYFIRVRAVMYGDAVGRWSNVVSVTTSEPQLIGVTPEALPPSSPPTGLQQVSTGKTPLTFWQKGYSIVQFTAPTDWADGYREGQSGYPGFLFNRMEHVQYYTIYYLSHKELSGDDVEFNNINVPIHLIKQQTSYQDNGIARVRVPLLEMGESYYYFVTCTTLGGRESSTASPYPATGVISNDTTAPVISSVEFVDTNYESGLLFTHSYARIKITCEDSDLFALHLRFRRTNPPGMLWRHKFALRWSMEREGNDYYVDVGPLVFRGENYKYIVEAKGIDYSLNVSPTWVSSNEFNVDAVAPFDMRSATNVSFKVLPNTAGFFKRLRYRLKVNFTIPANNEGLARKFEIRVAQNLGGGSWRQFSYYHADPVDAEVGDTVTCFINLPWRIKTEYIPGQSSGIRVNVRSWINALPGYPLYSTPNKWRSPNDWGSSSEALFDSYEDSETVSDIADGYPQVTRRFLRQVSIKPVPDTYNYPDNFHYISVHATTTNVSTSTLLQNDVTGERNRRRSLIGTSFSTKDKQIHGRVPWLVWNSLTGSPRRQGTWLGAVRYHTIIHGWVCTENGFVSQPIKGGYVDGMYVEDSSLEGAGLADKTYELNDLKESLLMSEGSASSDGITLPVPVIVSSGVYPTAFGFHKRLRYQLTVTYRVPTSDDYELVKSVEIEVFCQGNSIGHYTLTPGTAGVNQTATIPLPVASLNPYQVGQPSGITYRLRTRRGVQVSSYTSTTGANFMALSSSDTTSFTPSVTLISRLFRTFNVRCVDDVVNLPNTISHFTVHARAITDNTTNWTPDTRVQSYDRVAIIPHEAATRDVPVQIPYFLAGTGDGATPTSRNHWVGPFLLTSSTLGVTFKIVAVGWEINNNYMRNTNVSQVSNECKASSGGIAVTDDEVSLPVVPVNTISAYAGDVVFAPAIKSLFTPVLDSGYTYYIRVDTTDDNQNAFSVNDIILLCKANTALTGMQKFYGRILSRGLRWVGIIYGYWFTIDFSFNGQTPTYQQLSEYVPGTILKVGRANATYRYVWMDSTDDCMKIVKNVADSNSWTELGTVEARFGTSTVTADLTATTINVGNVGHIRGGATSYSSGTGFWMGYDGGAYKFRFGNPSGKYISWDGSQLSINGDTISGTTISGGLSPGSGTDLCLTNWSHSMTFSSSAYNAMSWTSGTLKFGNNVQFTISAGSVTGMTTTTYIYFDKNVSQTTLQTTTTASDAVGSNRCLICVASPTVSPKKATFVVYGGKGVGVYVDNTQIAAGTITGSEIANRTIAAGNIISGTITSNEIASRTIVAGNIVSGTITGNEIATNTITAGHLQSNSVTADKIQSNAISADKIQSNAITSDKIQSGAVTASKISVTTLSAINARLGATQTYPGEDVWFKSDSTNYSFAVFGSTTTRKWCMGSNSASDSTLWIGKYSSFSAAPSEPTISFYESAKRINMSANNAQLEVSNGTVNISSGGTSSIYFKSGGTIRFYLDGADSPIALKPWATATYNLGKDTLRWKIIYCQTLNQSSTMAAKELIDTIDGGCLDTIARIPFYRYKYKAYDPGTDTYQTIKSDPDQPVHIGLIVEDCKNLPHSTLFIHDNGIDIGSYTSFLACAIKELYVKIQTLERSISS